MMFETKGFPIVPYILHSSEPLKVGYVFFEYWTGGPYKVKKVT